MASSSTSTIKLRPADPFDLIRWLARSQSDPRKAIAELVQNSLDANARRVTIERRRVRRSPALVIRDDGEGIVPEVSREEALRTIATNIGHSRKRGLSPRERHDEIVAGKYGIGLLGFWAPRQQPLRGLVELADHDFRLNDYLSSELRGMLLATGAGLEIQDHLARGLAERTFTVVPRRFVGERLVVPETAPVGGFPPARIELYLARGGEHATIEVSCAGTLVADDAGELRAEGLDRSPWVGHGLTGLIEFSAFQIPPGTRRWQVNASHDDYIALRGEPRTRLRYLLALFAKEVALRAHGVPGSEEALESLVEILAHAERNLASL